MAYFRKNNIEDAGDIWQELVYPKDENGRRDLEGCNGKPRSNGGPSPAPDVTTLAPEFDTTADSSIGEQEEVNESHSRAIDDLSVEILKPSA